MGETRRQDRYSTRRGASAPVRLMLLERDVDELEHDHAETVERVETLEGVVDAVLLEQAKLGTRVGVYAAIGASLGGAFTAGAVAALVTYLT